MVVTEIITSAEVLKQLIPIITSISKAINKKNKAIIKLEAKLKEINDDRIKQIIQEKITLEKAERDLFMKLTKVSKEIQKVLNGKKQNIGIENVDNITKLIRDIKPLFSEIKKIKEAKLNFQHKVYSLTINADLNKIILPKVKLEEMKKDLWEIETKIIQLDQLTKQKETKLFNLFSNMLNFMQNNKIKRKLSQLVNDLRQMAIVTEAEVQNDKKLEKVIELHFETLEENLIAA